MLCSLYLRRKWIHSFLTNTDHPFLVYQLNLGPKERDRIKCRQYKKKMRQNRKKRVSHNKVTNTTSLLPLTSWNPPGMVVTTEEKTQPVFLIDWPWVRKSSSPPSSNTCSTCVWISGYSHTAFAFNASSIFCTNPARWIGSLLRLEWYTNYYIFTTWILSWILKLGGGLKITCEGGPQTFKQQILPSQSDF
jgi:hypothetical protein